MWCLRCHNVGACAEAWICKTCRFKASEILIVDVASEALPVWTVWPYIINASFIPSQTKPLQVIFELTGIFIFRTLRIKVFYT